MAWQSTSRNNQEMVDRFERLGIIESKSVENAFRCVTRGAFVPEHLIDEAFRDTPLRGSPHIHMSAPHMYASILEDLELEEGMSFLNVGSGTGYFSTLAGYIIKKDGVNHGIELYESTVRFAREHVEDFLQHGPPDTKDICHPTFIAGNCFRLDSEQIKYDRVYCGAACPQSKVKFLLKLVKVYGFLIAPVGTRLIKLERLSEKEGKQTVINDVCFAPLIMPTPDELRLPKLVFPTVNKKQKEKDSTFPVVNFPVSKSQARKTLARMRALQDALECLENGCQLPTPFTYVPSMEQMNKIKRNTKKMNEIKQSKQQPKTKSIVSSVDSSMDFFSTSIQSSSSGRNNQSRPRESRPSNQETELVHLKGTKIKPEKGIPKDIWEHMSFDQQWQQILEYYYSICATTHERRQQCFHVKGVEFETLEEKLHDILSFKTYAKKMGLLCNDNKAEGQKEDKMKSPPVVEKDKTEHKVLHDLDWAEVSEEEATWLTLVRDTGNMDTSSDLSSFTPQASHDLSTFTPHASPDLSTFTPPTGNILAGRSVSRSLILDNLTELESNGDRIINYPSHASSRNVESSPTSEILSETSKLLNDTHVVSTDVPTTSDSVCSESTETNSVIPLRLLNVNAAASSHDVIATAQLPQDIPELTSNNEQNTNISCNLSVGNDELSSTCELFNDVSIASGEADTILYFESSESVNRTPVVCVNRTPVVCSDDQFPGVSNEIEAAVDQNRVETTRVTGGRLEEASIVNRTEITLPMQTQIPSVPHTQVNEIETVLSPVTPEVENMTGFPVNCESQKEKDESKSNQTTLSLSSSNKIEVRKRRKKRKSRKLIDIQMDKQSSESLHNLPGSNWGLEHDFELVSFLSKVGQSSEQILFRSSCPGVVRPDLFTRPELMLYPRICQFPATLLANRAVVLKRLTDIFDSVMDLLVGKSLDRNQFRSPYDKSYPLPSFDDKSFKSSGIPLSNDGTVASDTEKVKQHNHSLNNLKKSPESELLLEVDSMIGLELDNVKQQEEILFKKLKLLENLDKQYKEQTRLLKQQIDLIEEQQNLIQSCQIQVEFLDDSSREKLHHTQQVVFERKQHRHQLIERQKQIDWQQLLQGSEKREIMQMVQQLITLENRLLQEKEYLWKKGINYFQDENDDLSHFSKFVAKSGEIMERIRKSEFKMSSETSYEDSLIEMPYREKQSTIQYRYQPDNILARCRFLLPLTTKRYATIKDLLRNSEVSQPPHCPVVLLDRRTPLEERHTYPASRTIFMQLYVSLKSKSLNYRWKKCYDQWWEVKFSGEGIIDQGGGFRDSLAEIADELCPPSADMKECISLFIRTPNQRDEIGEHRDCYVPNPSCKRQCDLYRWLGQLMGAAFRTDETLPLALPPIIWKLLVGEHVTWKQDYTGVDAAAVKLVDGIELLDVETYEGLYGFEQCYTTILSDNSEVELKCNGADEIVQPNERHEYSVLVRKARMLESAQQVKCIREGLLSVLPEAILSCLTWKDLERGVCGEPEITVEDLKLNCRYGDDLTPESECILHFWTAVTSFSNEERSRLIRFVTGRKRLPSPFIVSRSSGEELSLPNASTCGSNLFLPNYANADIASEKLRYAIYHCVAIDTDTSPW